MKRHYVSALLFIAALASLWPFVIETASPLSTAKDPGVRGGVSAGNPLPGLTPGQAALFAAAKAEFMDTENVPDGLGPRMNLDSCVGCHVFPAPGGSSPQTNPQIAFATRLGADNTIPSFLSLHGPVREARFVQNPDGTPDGGVHSLFTIQGRSDAPGCTLAQPDFATAVGTDNVIFRIPTPTFGAGLIEQIPDSAIVANQAANAAVKKSLGIRGRPNIVLAGNAITGQPNMNGNDGTAARFGWKAQNKSLLLFSGEAYNVEMGITNELFQTERDETPGCNTVSIPNDTVDGNATTAIDATSAIEKFAFFMRYLAPPTPSPNFPGGATSINRGKSLFTTIGCAQCHTPTLTTGYSTIAALNKRSANLYSDLLIHDMGPGLADGISQGQAGPSEFRTAPLWGLGQRIFFLHDGRTSDLEVAIQQHASGSTRNGNASEANAVVSNFNGLSETDKQNLLNFLRSL
ncbi:MAG TPA: di-heme oxidoredictase family protein [Burkholderiales bacterium]|nr:di-heme oxidoredictase family protein [Burkholderiales bacterium]